MSAVERIQAATKRLNNIKSILGLVEVGGDPAELYARVETDDDENGDPTPYGLSLRGVDSDAEINEAFVALNRTVDAQLAILRLALGEARGSEFCWQFALPLANAILGVHS